ncbi:hypothetical protein C3E98_010850 [Pseudomonas sp. MWU13-2625]|nr:hypothetical protein C3E98_010850 [Pseudomonas sp. MWU13-2625]
MVIGPAPSRASPLPQGYVLNTNSVNNTHPCGSGLAREKASTGDPKKCPVTGLGISSLKHSLTDTAALCPAAAAADHHTADPESPSG